MRGRAHLLRGLIARRFEGVWEVVLGIIWHSHRLVNGLPEGIEALISSGHGRKRSVTWVKRDRDSYQALNAIIRSNGLQLFNFLTFSPSEARYREPQMAKSLTKG